jgi:ammonium transporter Rh
MFGAYFGLAASRVFSEPKTSSSQNASPNAISDVLSLIGTTLLWVYWPSFVGATVSGDPTSEKYCVLQTVLALLGSTGATFFMSHYLRHGQFDPVHVANSTLAGGVAVGASARLDMTPGGALLLGMVAGAVSVYGYVNITPLLEEKLGLYDTCGVHNLHGLPSIIGGIGSILFAFVNSDASFLIHAPTLQAICQFSGVIVTILAALVSGSITGAVMVMSVRQETARAEYDDAAWWDGEYFDYASIFQNGNKETQYDSTKHVDETTSLV